MKRIIKSIISFIKNFVLFMIYLCKCFINILRYKRFPYKKTKSGRLTLLANAPSLKEVLPRVTTDEEFKNTDFVVLNYFVNCEEFWQLKPTHYCFADPMFFYKQHRYDDVMAVFDKLQNNVDWDINIYIPSVHYKRFLSFAGLTNSYLHIIPVSYLSYSGFASLRNWFYKHNYSSPLFSTVAILAIYIGINSGYDEIDLYGVDHTFFDGLSVNENNEVCTLEKHFYNTTPTLKPMRRNDNNEIWRMSDYVFAIGNMFKSHDLIREYSDYMNVRIMNKTKCSLIDSYCRG